jgi:hypothetical protein
MTEPGSSHNRDPNDRDGTAVQDDEDQTFGDIYNGFSFGGGGGKRKRKRREPDPPPPSAEPEPPEPPAPSVQRVRRQVPPPTVPLPSPDPPDPPEQPAYRPHPALPPKAQEISWPETGVEPVEPAEPDSGQEAPQIVRAYAWTRGRTTSQFKLEIETLLTIGDRYRSTDEWLQAEYHSIAALCRQPRSVAEVAALLSIPLGVAKVLLGDMAAQGLLVVHEVAGTDGQGPDLVLMERILSGLRRL